MRGIAALAVALLHFAGLQIEENIRSGLDWQRYGWMGVDMFFIVSGFIMVWVTAGLSGDRRSAIRFLAMRIVRIYPLWFSCVILVGLYFYIGNGVPVQPTEVPRDEAWPYFIRSFFLIPQEKAPLIVLGWTLIHEMFFYLLFALLLALGLRQKLPYAIIAWAGVTAIGVHLGWGDLSPALEVMFSPLSFLFMGGMVVALLALQSDRLVFAKSALIIGITLFAGLFLTDLDLRDARVLYLILPFSLILYGFVGWEKGTGRAVSTLLSWLGDISYSIYLVHYLVIIGWRTYLKPFYSGGPLYGRGSPELIIVIDTVCLIAATLITASIFYSVIEKPALRFFRSVIPTYRTGASQDAKSAG